MNQTEVQTTLNTRATTHGDFLDNARVMQQLKLVCRAGPNWHLLPDTHKEAIEMICHKLGRILCGNPDHTDHWHDIAGYSQLIENILLTGKSHPTLTK
jgi:hypothetical protein